MPKINVVSDKPCHDPFYYLNKGSTSRLAPCLPMGTGLPKNAAHAKSHAALIPLHKALQEPSQKKPTHSSRIKLKPLKARRVALKGCVPSTEHHQSYRLPTPTFKADSRPVYSAEEYLLDIPEDFEARPVHLPPLNYGGGTFRIIKW